VVLYHLLRAAGRPVELCIGVTRVARDARLSAHAWLLLDGAPYLESETPSTGLPIVARFPDALAHYG
jgi:transglutaminase superfamily protein